MRLFILSLLFVSVNVSAQHYIEATISNEDKAIGMNYINPKIGLALGAESGLYHGYNYKIKHQRYKVGFAKIFAAPTNWESDILVNLSACYNHYDVKYKSDTFGKLKKFSIDLGVRPNITDHIFIGLNYDIILLHGGFSVGFLID